MSWTDEEIDELFQGAASEQTFPYKEEYWAEMEALLPEKNTGRDLLWTITALIFVSLLTVGFWRNELPGAQEDTLSTQTRPKNQVIESEKVNLSVIETNAPSAIQSEEIQAKHVDVEQNHSSVFTSPESLIKVRKTTAEKDISANQMLNEINPDEANEQLEIDNRRVLNETVEVSKLTTRDPELFTATEGELLSLLNHVKTSGANHAFYVQGVVGASQSLVKPSGSLSSSFGFGAGWALRKGNFVANAGVNLLVSNHNDLFLSRTAKVYGFGAENYSYNFNYKQLYELEAQIDVGYQFKRSEFRLGVRPSYLLSSRVMISSTKSEQGKDTETLESEKQVYSFTGGLNRFGLKPSLTYAYHVKPTLELGLSVGTQIYGRIDADYLKGHTRNFVFDGQLYLRQIITWEKK